LFSVARTGAESTKLVVLRGNSGSGKSTTARALRAALGRGVALVEQDYLRRIVLRELDVVDGRNIGLIDQTARYALDCGYSVILEGILSTDRYRGLLAALHRDHRGQTAFYYLHISLEETLRRHASRPQSAEFGPDVIRSLYRNRDLLDFRGTDHRPDRHPRRDR
jgi:predicted kinase